MRKNIRGQRVEVGAVLHMSAFKGKVQGSINKIFAAAASALICDAIVLHEEGSQSEEKRDKKNLSGMRHTFCIVYNFLLG